ncbi:peptidoglycan-binding protein [Bacteroidia bacterium]|nr:peptidoglycan-binding protein [Bacteroidia bacterium]MDC1395148.1 peptidoglycan-binding protein [Bacteroidia bacterium]
MVWCLVEVPAQYKTVSKRVLASAASSIEVTILGKSKTVTKRVMVSSPVTREETIPAVYKTVMTAAPKIIENDVPAQYQTITKTVVDVPASLREIDIPAEYKTVTKRVLVKAGSFSEYREVVCSKNITSQLVRQVQRALLAKGYTVSPAGTDNVLGKDTRAALIKYQKDNGLPVGNTNVETMKHLGIKGY